jgi:hypothetical protein
MAHFWFYTTLALFVVSIVVTICLIADSVRYNSDTTDNQIVAGLLTIFVTGVAFILIGGSNYTFPKVLEYKTTERGTVFLFEDDVLFNDNVEVYKNPSKAIIRKDLLGNCQVIIP